MSQDNRYIAALEISSSKVAAVVGRQTSPGHVEIIASEMEKGIDGVRYGHIQNLEETSLRVARILNRLEQKNGISPKKIKGVYIGLNGRSLRSISTNASLNLPDDTEITQEILDRLRQQAKTTAIDSSLETVDAVDRTFTVGKTVTNNPRGAVGNHIAGVYDLIVCRPELKRNIVRSIPEKLHINDEGYVVTALATGHLLLSKEEKRLGCMLVDIGAETTTVSIYREGGLCYFATLPLGGRNITRDIQTLGLLEERAEDIKINSGNAIPPTMHSDLNVNGVKLSEVHNLVVARSEEIAANIIQQIELAGLKEKDLPAGIKLIGGAVNLKGFDELLRRQSGMTVSRASLPPYMTFGPGMAWRDELMQVSSILYAVATNDGVECLEEPAAIGLPPTGDPNSPDQPAADEKEEEREEKRPNKLMSILKKKVSGFFGDPEKEESDLF